MERYHFGSLFRSPFGRLLALIFLVFAIIPTLALFIFGAVTLRGQLENRSIAQMQTIADLNQASVTQWTDAAYNSLQATLENPVITQNALFVLQSDAASRSAQVLANDLLSLTASGYFTRIYLIYPEGRIVLSTAPDLQVENLNVNIGELAQQGEHFWGFSDDSALDHPTAFTWLPIEDRRQQAAGYLVGELNLETITGIIEQSGLSVGQTVSTHIINTEGTELAPDSAADWNAEMVADTLQQSETYTGLFTNPAGQTVIGTVQPLAAPLQAWLVVTQQETEAFQLLYDAAPLAVVFVILLTALAILVALPTTQSIINPLQNLQYAAQGMAGGDLETRVDIQRADEFGSLAVSFNQMADELQQAFGRLENTNEALANRAEQLATITRLGQLATQFLTLDDLLVTATGEIQQAFGYHAVVVYLPDDDDRQLMARAAAGHNTELMVDHLVQSLAPDNPVGISATERYTVVVNFADEPQYAAYKLHPDVRTEVNIPLVLGVQEKRLIGMLNIQSALPGNFGDDEIEVLEIFARQLAIAIRNTELFDESEHARHLADMANQQKSEFLSNMSHELRTPLNVIIGYSHSILNRPAMYQHVALPSVYAQAIESIMTSGQHLLGLINDILDLSKIEAGRIDLEIKPIDPLPILTGVRATALGLVKEGVNVYTNYAEKLPLIMGDELRVRQILLNLVSNAAKFTEHGALTLGARAQGESLLFWVTDTGTGIPETAQQSLFERFQQAHGRNEARSIGTGLGLSISRELTRLQGGDIWFHSKPGEGSAFYFTIPLAALVSDEVYAKVTAAAATAESSKRVSIFEEEQEPVGIMKQILLVDPLSDTRTVLYNALSSRGYDVLAVNLEDDAVTLATVLLPDALVLHLREHSDEMEQLAASLRAEESLSHIPLLVLRETGLTGKADADEAVIEKIFMEISEVVTSGNSVEGIG